MTNRPFKRSERVSRPSFHSIVMICRSIEEPEDAQRDSNDDEESDDDLEVVLDPNEDTAPPVKRMQMSMKPSQPTKTGQFRVDIINHLRHL